MIIYFIQINGCVSNFNIFLIIYNTPDEVKTKITKPIVSWYELKVDKTDTFNCNKNVSLGKLMN